MVYLDSVSVHEGVSTGSPALLLFPTELEQRRFQDLGGLQPGHALQSISGFGPIVAAARTAALLARIRPSRVYLLGIAGAYDADAHAPGEALVFSSVGVDGVGAGRGQDFLSPPRLGFPQWPGSTDGRADDVIELCCPPHRDDGMLLTTCAAAACAEETRERIERYPQAVAEDMEGFGVALACATEKVPLTIVRGISNRVGDRDASRWKIPAALAAARRVLLELLQA